VTAMPDDVRQKIAALFPERRPPPAARAQSIHERGATTAGVMAFVDAADPDLGAALERIMAVDLPDEPQTRDEVVLELRDTAVAVRLVAYRRELVRLGRRLGDAPTDTAAVERIGVLTAAVRTLEGRFPQAAQRAHRELNGETR